MKHIALGLVILLLLVPALNVAAQDGPTAFPPEVVAEMQAAMDDLTEGGRPPGMVVWIDAPEYQFAGASGFADVAGEVAMPPDGAFRIGSITKMFTATVIVQLAEEGALTLDDPLALWLPDVADQLPYGDQITLRQLLGHTAGVYNMTNNTAYARDIREDAVIDEDAGIATLTCVQWDPHDILARYVYGQPASFAPGAQWGYSNTNYILLGMVIELAGDVSVAEAYRTRIFEPLGMESTHLDCYEDAVIDVVHGYTGTRTDMVDVTALHEAAAWSAGGLVSTAPDLIAFARGLFSGALFDDPASLMALTTPGKYGNYGLGVMFESIFLGHGGGIAGFRTLLHYAPNLDTVVVVLYNTDSAEPGRAEMAVLGPVIPLLRE